MSRAEDTYFNLQVMERLNFFYCSPEIGYRYLRVNENSLWGKFHKDIYEIHNKVFSKLRELMKMNRVENSTIETSYFINLINGLYEHFWHYDETTIKEKKEYLKKIANDKNVKKYKLRQFNGKARLFLLLIKVRAYTLILIILKKRHKRI